MYSGDIEIHIYKTWCIFCCKFLGSFYLNKRSPKRSIKEQDSRHIDYVEALRAHLTLVDLSSGSFVNLLSPRFISTYPNVIFH